jgi:Nif-specific regulatory protein
VPLALLNKPLGFIYLDTRNPNTRFDKAQMQMVIAIANIAAGVLSNALHAERLESENRHLHTAINIRHDMVGESGRMSELYQIIAKIAATDITVLIGGESGTGKELAARAIHKNSPRAKLPFVALNCAAITESLLDSELFGHEKGAFTDARAQKRGPLELAEGGTLFLDEVGELSPQAQAKMLRVLQEREVVRVGGTMPVKFDVRFVAATNKNLPEEIERGAFRKDLYFRLSMFPVEMPPLRERREDILLLAKHFMRKYDGKYKRGIKGFSAETRALLINYGWPGNVRELENAIAYAVALCSSDYLLPEHLPKSIHSAGACAAADRPYLELVKEGKRRILLEALGKAGGDHATAARILHIHPNNLHRLLRTLNLRATQGMKG